MSLASKVRMCGKVCGGGEHQSVELHPIYFTLPREGIGIISQEASQQSLALIGGSLTVKLKHACIHACSLGRCEEEKVSTSQTSVLPL